MHKTYIRQPQGAKRAVVLIHGICSTPPRHFDWLLPEFDDSWAVYNILLDGHGGSVRDFADSSMEKWKAQTAAVLTEVSEKYEDILAIGYSMGTMLHIHALPNFPKVRGLLLLNPPMRPWVRFGMWRRSIRFTKGRIDQQNPHEAACSRSIGTALTPGLGQYIRWVPRFWELLGICRYCRKHYRDINVPCYAYLGGLDELVSLRSRKYFEKDVTLRVFPEAGHFYFPPENRETLRQDLRDLIKTI